MRQCFAVILALCLWLGAAAPASADGGAANLTPCNESSAFQARAAAASTPQAERRFDLYADSNVLCGPEGLPHLLVDGRLNHAGEFIIPSILFLYIAGWIGWAGRAYLIKVREDKKPEEKEIIIDVPLALSIILSALAWPATAVKEFLSGELVEAEENITVSPR
ncbi:MAG: Photosystem I reaction center subunit III [Elainellaceae cyanobacterium]